MWQRGVGHRGVRADVGRVDGGAVCAGSEPPQRGRRDVRRATQVDRCPAFSSPHLADFHDLCISSDEQLFNQILTYPDHTLRTLLPPPTAQNFNLRNRPP